VPVEISFWGNRAIIAVTGCGDKVSLVGRRGTEERETHHLGSESGSRATENQDSVDHYITSCCFERGEHAATDGRQSSCKEKPRMVMSIFRNFAFSQLHILCQLKSLTQRARNNRHTETTKHIQQESDPAMHWRLMLNNLEPNRNIILHNTHPPQTNQRDNSREDHAFIPDDACRDYSVFLLAPFPGAEEHDHQC
jgi:hypothetical protein